MTLNPVFQLKSDTVTAFAQVRGGEFTVLSGSEFRKDSRAAFGGKYQDYLDQLQHEGVLADDGDHWLLMRDTPFATASEATIVLLHAQNITSSGWMTYLGDGKWMTYGAWREEKRPAVVKSEMTDEWYKLHRSIHYVVYHSESIMTYFFDQATPCTLLTKKQGEVKEARSLIERGDAMPAAVWVIEGLSAYDGMRYYLREVFHPAQILTANPEDSTGARKTFDWRLSGPGQVFGRGIRLDTFDWFPELNKNYANFGAGLSHLRYKEMKDHFLALARPYFAAK